MNNVRTYPKKDGISFRFSRKQKEIAQSQKEASLERKRKLIKQTAERILKREIDDNLLQRIFERFEKFGKVHKSETFKKVASILVALGFTLSQTGCVQPPQVSESKPSSADKTALHAAPDLSDPNLKPAVFKIDDKKSIEPLQEESKELVSDSGLLNKQAIDNPKEKQPVVLKTDGDPDEKTHIKKLVGKKDSSTLGQKGDLSDKNQVSESKVKAVADRIGTSHENLNNWMQMIAQEATAEEKEQLQKILEAMKKDPGKGDKVAIRLEQNIELMDFILQFLERLELKSKKDMEKADLKEKEGLKEKKEAIAEKERLYREIEDMKKAREAARLKEEKADQKIAEAILEQERLQEQLKERAKESARVDELIFSRDGSNDKINAKKDRGEVLVNKIINLAKKHQKDKGILSTLRAMPEGALKLKRMSLTEVERSVQGVDVFYKPLLKQLANSGK